jgi:hypothetical protein
MLSHEENLRALGIYPGAFDFLTHNAAAHALDGRRSGDDATFSYHDSRSVARISRGPPIKAQAN